MYNIYKIKIKIKIKKKMKKDKGIKSLNWAIIILTIFYIVLSTVAIFDIYFSIKFQIETENKLILCLIFLILFPISLLFQSFFIFLSIKDDADYEYQKIQDKVEIINAERIFELDFRYLDEDLNRGIIIMLISSILSYSKLIVFHIFINSYKNSTKFGFFQSLKHTLLKISFLQIIFQAIPFFIRKIVNDINYIQENNEELSLDKFLKEYYYLNFGVFILIFCLYFIFYNFFFSPLEKKLIKENSDEFDNHYNTDFDNSSVISLNHKKEDDSIKNSTFTYNYNSGKKVNSVYRKINNNESVEIRNSF